MSFSRFWILLVVLGSVLACCPAGAEDLPVPEKAALPPPVKVEEPTVAWTRKNEVCRETRRLLAARDTAGLEKLAAELRASKESLDGGTWMLSMFYDEAVKVPGETIAAENAAMEFYRKWAADRPESITAQVCLTQALVRYAWNARGSGWASEVSEDGWRLMKERLAEAGDVLKKARQLPEKCPGWYTAAQSVALGQSWSHAQYMKILDEALSLEPTYGEYYTKACYWMLPRWHGEAGDFEKWIAERADAYPEAERDREYARLVWMADRMPVKSEVVFGPGRLDWERTKRGFHQWLEEKPGNFMIQTEFTLLAIRAGDRATARELFDATGGRYFPYSWKEETFEKARQFAYAGGPDPFAKVEKKKAARTIAPHIVEYVRLGVRHLSGFFGGLLAGVCLLVIALRRQALWPGVIALVACIVLGAALGTMTSLIPAAGLWLYLRRHPVLSEVEAPSSPGWLVLLGGLGVTAVYLGLQLAAVIIVMIPFLMANPQASENEITQVVMTDGTAYRLCLSAAWVALLTLIAICPPQSRRGWEYRLGLHVPAILPALGWFLASAIVLVIATYGFDQILDERSREAIKVMALGLATPVPFFLAVVVAAPILEELVFRGYLFSGWITKIGFWGTALATSFLFTIMHIQYGPVALANVFVMGLVLSALRWKTGSVYPCIALHILINLGAVLCACYSEV